MHILETKFISSIYDIKVGDIFRGTKILKIEKIRYRNQNNVIQLKYILYMKCSKCKKEYKMIYSKTSSRKSKLPIICKSCRYGCDVIDNSHTYHLHPGDILLGQELIEITKNKISNGNICIWKCSYCGSLYECTQINMKKLKKPNCGCQGHTQSYLAKFGVNSRHPLVGCYYNMMSRCYETDMSRPEYRCYSHKKTAYGDGIKVCKYWRESIGNFISWSIENGWEQGKSLDRIDSNGDYSPFNCRWVSCQENSKKAVTIDRFYNNHNFLRKLRSIEYKLKQKKWIQHMEKLGFKEGDLI